MALLFLIFYLNKLTVECMYSGLTGKFLVTDKVLFLLLTLQLPRPLLMLYYCKHGAYVILNLYLRVYSLSHTPLFHNSTQKFGEYIHFYFTHFRHFFQAAIMCLWSQNCQIPQLQQWHKIVVFLCTQLILLTTFFIHLVSFVGHYVCSLNLSF